MRHLKSGYHLNRTASHRKAMLSNLSAALFERKRIKTTLAKAKAARSVAERFITMAKKGDLASRRRVLRFIPEKRIVKILFEDIAPMYADRPGGYSRIVKLGQRHGDGAPLAILELVGFETVVPTKKAAKKKAEKNKDKDKAKEEETAKARPAKGKKKTEKAAEEEKVEAAVEEKKPKKTRKKAAKPAKEEVVEPEVEVTEEPEVAEEPKEATEEATTEEETPPEEPEEEDEETKKEE